MEILIVLAVIAIALVLGLKIFAVLLLGGLVGLTLTEGWTITLRVLASVPFNYLTQQALVVVALFVLMGTIVHQSGTTSDLFALTARLARRLPGGVGMATVLTGGGLAAITGSSVAVSGLVARIAIPDLLRAGYSREFAAGLVATVGSLGVLIPPSILLVIYGIVAEVSIGRLLLAAVVPGALTVLALLVTVFVIQLREGRRAAEGLPEAVRAGAAGQASAVDNTPGRGDLTAPEVDARVVSSVAWIALMFLVVIGGIYLGWFTALEAGAVGVLLATLLLLMRAGRSALRRFRLGLAEAIEVSGMIYLIILGASVFGYYITASGIPRSLARVVTEDISVPPIMILALLLLILVPLGMFMESITIILVSVPLILPVALSLGYDPIWLGVVMVKLCELGLVTPPVGLNAFAVSGGDAGIRPEEAFQGVRPFLLVDLILIGVLFSFPSLVTWLPGLMS